MAVKSSLKFFLLKLPVLSIALFFVLTTIAAIYYPGSVREGIGFECDHYSFTHNFLSELGTFEVNSDETNPFAIKSDNTFSMLLFNFSLLIIGFCIVCFYIFLVNYLVLLMTILKQYYTQRYLHPWELLQVFFMQV